MPRQLLRDEFLPCKHLGEVVGPPKAHLFHRLSSPAEEMGEEFLLSQILTDAVTPTLVMAWALRSSLRGNLLKWD